MKRVRHGKRGGVGRCGASNERPWNREVRENINGEDEMDSRRTPNTNLNLFPTVTT